MSKKVKTELDDRVEAARLKASDLTEYFTGTLVEKIIDENLNNLENRLRVGDYEFACNYLLPSLESRLQQAQTEKERIETSTC